MIDERPTEKRGWSPLPFSLSAPSEESTVDMSRVLHGEEVDRARAFFRIILAIALLTAGFIPFLTGGAWLRFMAASLCTVVAAMSGAVLVVLRNQARYTSRLVTGIGITFAAIGVAVIYYVGVFSAGAMVLVLGVYFFGSSHSRRAARATYITVALLYLAASLGTAAGVLPDVALFSTKSTRTFTMLFQTLMSQVIFALTFYLARRSRRATEQAVDRANKATREVKVRAAQLDEVQVQLAKVMKQDEGRYTDANIAGYRVGKLLGRGAMGEVYRATDKADLEVAIKILHSNLLSNATHVKRFLREAEAAGAVDSPHVPKIYETGWTDDGAPYLVMELLEGHDLGWHLRKTNTLQLKLVVEMVEHVSKALAHVREGGIVHRDLKPANLLLTDSLPRNWKVLDFGLSKILWEAGSMTRDSAVGTPSYMAPEQIKGPTVDHLTDLYALGAIAYRAITGRPPFLGHEIAQVLYRVVYHQPPSPAELARIPIDVELVLAIAMAKKREDRFEDVEHFASAFRDAYHGRLHDDLRTRGWALINQHPWGSSRLPSPESMRPKALS